MNQGINRREFLKIAPAAGIAGVLQGCTPNQQQAAPAQKPIPAGDPNINVYDILEKYDFTDSKGVSLNVNALRTTLQNQYTTVSFGFSRCAAVCPRTNANLAALAAKHNNIAHIIISSDPLDNVSQQSRDNFASKCKQQGIDSSRLIILYPEDRAKQVKIQNDFGELYVSDAPSHTSQAFLHAPNGNLLAQVKGNLSEKDVLNVFEPSIVPTLGRE